MSNTTTANRVTFLILGGSRTYGSASQHLNVAGDVTGIALSVADAPQNANQPKP